jgi:hypothetical protein
MSTAFNPIKNSIRAPYIIIPIIHLIEVCIHSGANSASTTYTKPHISIQMPDTTPDITLTHIIIQ